MGTFVGTLSNETKIHDRTPLKLSIYEVLLMADLKQIQYIYVYKPNDPNSQVNIHEWMCSFKNEKTVEIPILSHGEVVAEDLSILEEYKENTNICYRYRIYYDLWNKGHFVQIGNSYGVDLVVYEDNPQNVHATYLVKIVDYEQEVTSLDFVASVRISNSINKELLLAYVHSDRVEYIKVGWEGVS